MEQREIVVGRAELPFALAEYAGRLERVRRRMEAAGIEVLLTTVPENIVYLTGYSTLGYFKRKDIDQLIHIAVVSHHLIEFTRHCLRGAGESSFYAAVVPAASTQRAAAV